MKNACDIAGDRIKKIMVINSFITMFGEVGGEW